jgi:glycerol-3-phosphate O-acyltransferase
MINSKHGQKSIMMLAYYRNNLTHLFINEAEIACALFGLGAHSPLKNGVTLEQVWEKASLLKSFMNEEYVVRDTMRTMHDFKKQVDFMASRQFFTELSANVIKVDMSLEL